MKLVLSRKYFTTLLLADQIKKGSIQLNTPILSLLPNREKEYSRSLQNVNVLNLATHTSGLPRITIRSVNGSLLSRVLYPWGVYRLLFGYDPYSRYDTTKLFKDLRSVQLETKPGRKFSYSNLGVTLLGYVVAHKSKMSYDSLLTKTILDTLNMNHTWTRLPQSQMQNFATGHNRLGFRTPRWTFKDDMEGAGALNSTVNDLMKFLSVNLNNDNKYLHDLLGDCQKTYFKESEHRNIGLAWIKSNSEKTDNHEIIWHNGGTGGFRSFLGFNKESKVGVVVLSNTSKEVDALSIDILKQLMKEKSNPPMDKPLSIK